MFLRVNTVVLVCALTCYREQRNYVYYTVSSKWRQCGNYVLFCISQTESPVRTAMICTRYLIAGKNPLRAISEKTTGKAINKKGYGLTDFR